MQERYPAVYTDDNGQEQTVIELEPAGYLLSTTVRGVSFRGLSFTTFHVWPNEQNAESLQRFHLRRSHITSGDGSPPAQQRLVEYTLQWTMPLPVVKQGQTIQGTLCGIVEDVEPHGEDRFGFVHLALEFQVKETLVKVAGKDLEMEDALPQLQQQLPPGMYLKCCQFCALSVVAPHGGMGFLCFRNTKEQIRAIKHEKKQKHPAIELWQHRVGYVQETYLCPEFEKDPVLLPEE